jgi:hypothetical protein
VYGPVRLSTALVGRRVLLGATLCLSREPAGSGVRRCRESEPEIPTWFSPGEFVDGAAPYLYMFSVFCLSGLAARRYVLGVLFDVVRQLDDMF